MNLTIIDVSGWIYRNFYGNPRMARSDGQQTGAIHGCTNALWRLMQSNPAHICAVYDVAKHTWRNDVYGLYKANRPPSPDGLPEQIPLIKRAIETFGVHSIGVPTYEADDVIATLVRKALEAGMDATIVSSDKDLMGLITEGDETPSCRMFDPMTHKMIGPDDVASNPKFGVRPAQMYDFLALTGDAIDNVPGVPGIGPKTAAKLINAYGTLDNILFEAQQLNPDLKPKEQTNLNLFAPDALLSRQLVQLKDDAPIELDLEAMRCRTPDSQRVSDFLDEMEFVTLRDVIFGQVAA